MKEMWMECHEELIAEFLEANPGISWSSAYELTADHVNDRLIDKYSAMVDWERMQAKEQE